MAPSTSAPESPPPLGDDEEEGEEEDEESPVTEPPIGQSYQKLSFRFTDHLKLACANYGPTAPFTLALLENQNAEAHVKDPVPKDVETAPHTITCLGPDASPISPGLQPPQSVPGC
ncbi:hypothetical protein STEG23_027960 [Scotinomys teguina]